MCRSVPAKKRIDESEDYNLDHIRRSLIRQEDSIIFCLLERAKYCYNADTYDPDAFSMDGFNGSLVEYMLKGTEKLHAKVWNQKLDDHVIFYFFLTWFAFHCRWVDTRALMSIHSSLRAYLNQCYHL